MSTFRHDFEDISASLKRKQKMRDNAMKKNPKAIIYNNIRRLYWIPSIIGVIYFTLKLLRFETPPFILEKAGITSFSITTFFLGIWTVYTGISPYPGNRGIPPYKAWDPRPGARFGGVMMILLATLLAYFIYTNNLNLLYELILTRG
jgi:hypothetical protein